MRPLLVLGLLAMSSPAAAQPAWGEALREIAPAQTTVPVEPYDIMEHKRRQEEARRRRIGFGPSIVFG